MTFEAWIQGLRIVSKKSERECHLALRAKEDAFGVEDIKGLTRSIAKEGQKIRIKIECLDDDHKVTTTVEKQAWATTLKVWQGESGRYVQTMIRIPESQLTAIEIKALAQSIRSAEESSVSVWLEPAGGDQIEIPDQQGAVLRAV